LGRSGPDAAEEYAVSEAGGDGLIGFQLGNGADQRSFRRKNEGIAAIENGEWR